MTEIEQRARVVAIARSWIGTKYHHRGRIKGVGVDCAQLLVEVFAEAGLLERFDTGDYPMDWAAHRDDERFLGFVERYGRQVPAALPGDVLVFRYFRCYSHGAIAVDDSLMIHSYIGRGVELVERSEFANRPCLTYSIIGGTHGR